MSVYILGCFLRYARTVPLPSSELRPDQMKTERSRPSKESYRKSAEL